MDSEEIPRNTDNHADETCVDRHSEVETDEGIGASNSTPHNVSSMIHISSDIISHFGLRHSYRILSNAEQGYDNVFYNRMRCMRRSSSVLYNDERGYDTALYAPWGFMRRSYSEPSIAQTHVELSNCGQFIDEVHTGSCYSVMSSLSSNCESNKESCNSLPSVDETHSLTPYVDEINQVTPSVAAINQVTPSADEIHSESSPPEELHPSACEDEETMLKAIINVCYSHSHQSGAAFADSPSSSPDASLGPTDEQDESEPIQHGSIQLRNPEVHQDGVSPQSVPHLDQRQEVFQLNLSEEFHLLNVRCRIYGDQERQPNRPTDEQDESEPIQHGSIQLRNPEVHQDGVSPQSVPHLDQRQEVFQLNLSEEFRLLNVRCRIYGDQERQPNREDIGNDLAGAVQAESDENDDVMLSSPAHPVPTDVDVNQDVDLGVERLNRTCSTCFQRPRCTVSYPCGHRNNCLECARVMRRCSVCLSPIQCYSKCPDCNCQQ